MVFCSVKIDEFRSKRNAGVERIHAQKHTHTYKDTLLQGRCVIAFRGCKKAKFYCYWFFLRFLFCFKNTFQHYSRNFCILAMLCNNKNIQRTHMYINDAYKQTQITTTSLTLTKNKNCYDGHLGRAAQSASLPQSLGKGSMLN